MNYKLRYTSKNGSRYYVVADDDGCVANVRVSNHPIRDRRWTARRINVCLQADLIPKKSGLVREFKKIIKTIHLAKHKKAE